MDDEVWAPEESPKWSDYLIFVDESGDHSLTSIDSSYPVFVLAFCVVEKSKYLESVVAPFKRLKHRMFGHDEVILHEADLRRKRGPFTRLNKERREVLLDDLTDIIDEADFTLISVIVDKLRHRERYVSPEHPYHLALKYGLERVYSFLAIRKQHGLQTSVICECRGVSEDAELELQFRRICDRNNRGRAVYPFTLVMKDKRSNSEGLQLADLAARPIGLSHIRPAQTNRAYATLEKKFFRSRTDTIVGNGRKVFPT